MILNDESLDAPHRACLVWDSTIMLTRVYGAILYIHENLWRFVTVRSSMLLVMHIGYVLVSDCNMSWTTQSLYHMDEAHLHADGVL